MTVTQISPVTPKSAFRKRVEELSGERTTACFQCEKCTNGCPVTFAMDIAPNRLMRAIQLGLEDMVLQSDTIWVCTSCETCTTRCPNDIDIAHIMDTLRQLSRARGVKDSQKSVPLFHSAFLNSVKWFGRVHELTMASTFALRSEGIKGIRKQAGMGIEMIKKGKIKIIPGRLRAGRQVKSIFRHTGREKKS
jgi:heterodisulfide reductase subunit C